MNKIEFTNKVWVTKKRKLWSIAKVLCVIYIVLDLITILGEGIKANNVFGIFAAMMGIMWTSFYSRKAGSYVDTECMIDFSESEVVWEYPRLPSSHGAGYSHTRYHVRTEDIKNISVSNEASSVTVECCPVIETITNGKSTTTDYRKDNKSCVLTAYNCDAKKLADLFSQFAGRTATFID